jgi:hypothetical protein
MPNTPHQVRIDDELWAEALAIATERDETLSQVIRRALRDYVKAATAVAVVALAILSLGACSEDGLREVQTGIGAVLVTGEIDADAMADLERIHAEEIAEWAGR